MSETTDFLTADELLDRGDFAQLKERANKTPADFIKLKPSRLEIEVLTRIGAGGTLLYKGTSNGQKVETPVASVVHIPTESPSDPQLTLLEFSNGTSLVLEPINSDPENVAEYNAHSKAGGKVSFTSQEEVSDMAAKVLETVRSLPAALHAKVLYDPSNGDESHIQELRQKTLSTLSERRSELHAQGATPRHFRDMRPPERPPTTQPEEVNVLGPMLQPEKKRVPKRTAVGTLDRTE